MGNEIDNRIVFGVLIVAIAVSVGGTGLVLNKMNTLTESGEYGITGMATSDQGYARISIDELLAIDVSDTHNTINFGSCDISALGSEENASISSRLSESEINSSTVINCSSQGEEGAVYGAGADGTYIEILNVGNVDAIINVSSDIEATTLFGGASRAEMFFDSDDAGTNGGCQDPTSGWTELTTSSSQVCGNLTTGDNSNAVWVYINMTIPNDASTSGTAEAQLTFSGETA